MNEHRKSPAQRPPVAEVVPTPPIDVESLTPELITHIRLVTSALEGRLVSRDEIISMLKRILRQHRFVAGRRIDYVVEELSARRPDG